MSSYAHGFSVPYNGPSLHYWSRAARLSAPAPLVLTRRECVEHGARMLDARVAGWREAINLATLDVNSGSYCVLAQVWPLLARRIVLPEEKTFVPCPFDLTSTALGLSPEALSLGGFLPWMERYRIEVLGKRVEGTLSDEWRSYLTTEDPLVDVWVRVTEDGTTETLILPEIPQRERERVGA